MKLREITNPDFIKALSAIMSIKIPSKAAYWFGKTTNKINSELKHFDDARLSTLKKYAAQNDDGSIKTDEKGDAVFNGDGPRENFQKEYQALLDIEVEIKKIPFSLLGDDVEIEPSTLLFLDPILIDDSGYTITDLKDVK